MKVENDFVKKIVKNIRFVISLEMTKCTNCYTGQLSFLLNSFLLFSRKKTQIEQQLTMP